MIFNPLTNYFRQKTSQKIAIHKTRTSENNNSRASESGSIIIDQIDSADAGGADEPDR